MKNIKVFRVDGDFFQIRVEDENIRFFESLWEIPEKITYNSYLLLGDECGILFDTVKGEFDREFINALRGITDPSSIRYLVVHHMEPDHSGAIKRILMENPEITVIGHPMSRMMIKSFYGLDPKFQPVKDGQELQVCGKKLRFLYAPWLHWPETIMTYIPDRKYLLTCDAFGSFGIPKEFVSRDVWFYSNETKKYFSNVIGKYRKNVIQALSKLEGLEISMILPSHGPIWADPGAIMEIYREWATGGRKAKKVVSVYASMYGFVKEAVRDALRIFYTLGYEVIEFPFLDTGWSALSEILMEAEDAPFLVIGSPTYEADVFPLMETVTKIITSKLSKNKKILVLSSYGWGGVAGKKIAQMLRDVGFEHVELVEFKGKFGGEDRRRIFEMIRKMA